MYAAVSSGIMFIPSHWSAASSEISALSEIIVFPSQLTSILITPSSLSVRLERVSGDIIILTGEISAVSSGAMTAISASYDAANSGEKDIFIWIFSAAFSPWFSILMLLISGI